MKRRRIWLLAAFGVLATWMAACGGGGGGSALGVGGGGGGGSTAASDPNPPDNDFLAGATAFPVALPDPVIVDYVDRWGNRFQVDAVPGRVIVLFDIGVSEQQAFQVIATNRGAVISKIPKCGFYYVGISQGQELSFIQEMRKRTDVIFAEPDFYMREEASYLSPLIYDQVGINEKAYLWAIDFPSAYNVIVNNTIIQQRVKDNIKIEVLVIDAGFNQHQVIQHLIPRYSEITSNKYANNLEGRVQDHGIVVGAGDTDVVAFPFPDNTASSDHGFKVISFLGSNWNSEKPIGINPYSPIIARTTQFQDSISACSRTLYNIIYEVGSKGREVVSMSMFPEYLFAGQDTLNRYVNNYVLINDVVKKLNRVGKKFVLAISAGNAHVDTSNGTLNFEKQKNFIIVGAYNANSEYQATGIASYSPYGKYIDIYVPGYQRPSGDETPPSTEIDGLYPIYLDGNLRYVAGTSFSAPIVAGVASMIWEVNPSLSPEQVVSILFDSSVRHPDQNGNRVLNYYKAVEEAVKILGIDLSYPTIITNDPLPSGSVGIAYNLALSATGGKTPYAWSVPAGGLPPGLALSTSGVVSGVPTLAGHYIFTVVVSTASNVSSMKEFTIDILGQGLLPAPTNPLAWYTDPSLNNVAVVLANTVPTADTYRLYSSTDNVNFSQVNFTPQVSGNAVAFDGLDVPINTYFKIAAVKAGVEGNRSNAVLLNFSQKNSLPVVAAVSPTEGQTGVSVTPTFQWSPFPGAAAYVLLSETPTQGNVLVKLSGTSWTLGYTSNVITKYVEDFTAYLPNTLCDYAVWAVDSNGTMIASIAQAVHFTTRSATLQIPVISTVKELSANDYIYPSIAVGPGNKAYISYVTYNNFSSVTSSLSYADNASGSWTAAVLDSGDVWASCPSSIAVDSGGYYHIAYDAGIGGVVYRTNKPGSPGITSIDSSGGQPDLAMGPDGSLHVAYWGNPSASPGTVSIKYATNSSGWTPFSIKDGMDWISGGQAPSIAVDGSGKVHIAYVEFNSVTLKTDIYYATNTTGSWVSTKIDSTLGGMLSLSIAVENGGTPHICYFDQVNMIYWTNSSGRWTNSTITNTGAILPPYISNVAVDSNGKLYIAYGGYLTNEFRYVTNRSGTWSSNLIESGISVFYSSIAVGSDGSIHVVYSFLGTNKNGLKYAYIPGP